MKEAISNSNAETKETQEKEGEEAALEAETEEDLMIEETEEEEVLPQGSYLI